MIVTQKMEEKIKGHCISQTTKIKNFMSNAMTDMEKRLENHISKVDNDMEEKIEDLTNHKEDAKHVPNAANLYRENAMYVVLIVLLLMIIILQLCVIAAVFYSLRKNNQGYITLVRGLTKEYLFW